MRMSLFIQSDPRFQRCQDQKIEVCGQCSVYVYAAGSSYKSCKVFQQDG